MRRFAIALALLMPAVAFAGRKPNVVVIVADDLGSADVGFQGCKDIPTPHLDALRRDGVRCTSGYVSHPFCSPTRAGLLTGRYQQRFGHENNPPYKPDDPTAGLPLGETLLPQRMKAAGYATGGVGKWHLGAHPTLHPTRRGFDEWFGFIGGGHAYLPDLNGSVEYKVPLQRGTTDIDEREYLTDAFSREAAAFVGRHKAEPFFLYLAYNAPHTPLHTLPKYVERVKHIADEKRRNYAALVCGVDDGVGVVRQALKDAGIEKDTLVFFFSDNGGPVAVTNGANTPLRGAKGQVYEGGVRVPFVAAWPGTLPANAEYAEPVIALDVFATACALAGVPMPTNKATDGVNIVPHLRGEAKTPPHERLYWRAGGGPRYAVREGRYKLVHQGQRDELYDLAADIGEATDLAAEKPDVLKRLQDAYAAWNAQLVPPAFEGPPPANPKGKAKAKG